MIDNLALGICAHQGHRKNTHSPKRPCFAVFPPRYLFNVEVVRPNNDTTYQASWDADIPTGEDIGMAFFSVQDGEYVFVTMSDTVRINCVLVCSTTLCSDLHDSYLRLWRTQMRLAVTRHPLQNHLWTLSRARRALPGSNRLGCAVGWKS